MSQAVASEEESLLECIDAGIDVFGKSVKNVIYWRLQTINNMERKDILRKPEVFSECLRSFFGERSFSIEQSIVAVLVDKFHMKDVTYSDSLTRGILEARKQVRSQRVG
jgi:hypothetical protein